MHNMEDAPCTSTDMEENQVDSEMTIYDAGIVNEIIQGFPEDSNGFDYTPSESVCGKHMANTLINRNPICFVHYKSRVIWLG